jgi:tRNA dimethylallyltransferase
VYEQCGAPAGELRANHAFGARRFPTWTVHVDIAREELEERLKGRTRTMMDAGWAEEVRGLIEKYGSSIRSLHSVGYHQMVDHVVHGVPLDTTEQQIVRATWQYARRQRTWFQSDPDVDVNMTPQQVLSRETMARINAFLAK